MKTGKIRKLIKTMQSIPPRQYEQRVYYHESPDCGYFACLAGHACLMEGYEPDALRVVQNEPLYVAGQRRGVEIYTAARKILGLSRANAERLFSATCVDWRHENETWGADTKEKQIEVAVKELKDLIRFGPYVKRQYIRRNPTARQARRARLELNRKRRALLRPVASPPAIVAAKLQP